MSVTTWISRWACRRHRKVLGLVALGMIPVSDDEVRAARAHLAGCPRCAVRFREHLLLAGLGRGLGGRLPAAEPSRAFEQQWMHAVRGTAGESCATDRARLRLRTPESAGIQAAWGGLAAVWGLILFFWFSAPALHRPPVISPTPGWRLVMMILREGARNAEPTAHKARAIPEAVTPAERPAGPRPRGGLDFDGAISKRRLV